MTDRRSFNDAIAAHAAAIQPLFDMHDTFSKMVAKWAHTISTGGKLMFFGNGGSAAQASHMAAELVCQLTKQRKAIAAIALTTDTSIITANSNDYGFATIFSRQIEAIGEEGDCAIGISTSGDSSNVLHGLVAANDRKIYTCALLGGLGGDARAVARCSLIVPSTDTQRIQEAHLLLGHMLCAALEEELGLV